MPAAQAERPPSGGARHVLRSMRRALLVPVRAAPGRMAVAAGVIGLSALLPVVVGWLLKTLLDALAEDGSPDRAVRAAAGLAVASLLIAVTPPFEEYNQEQLRRAVHRIVARDLFASLNRARSLRYFENPELHNRIQLAEQAGEQAPGELTMSAMTLIRSTVQMVGWGAALAVVWWPMLLIVAVAAVPAAVFQARSSRRRANVAADTSGTLRREMFYRQLLIDVRAAKEIRLFDAGAHLLRRMLREVDRANSALTVVDRRIAVGDTWFGALAAAAGAVGLVFAVSQATGARLTAGDVAMFVGAIAGSQSAAAGLASGVATGYLATLLFGHFLHVCEGDDGLSDGTVEAPSLTRAITFQDVWFRYADDLPWVLRGATFTIPAGCWTGIVGLNGAGKSTVLKLLCRFYDPERGAILWDGVDIRRFSIKTYRRRVSAVFQDYMSYELTAAENIALSDPPALNDPDRLHDAARSAGIDAELRALPSGYATTLSRMFVGDDDGGTAFLSGGQWQRLALARSFLRADVDLLLLDEHASGLDAEAEHRLHERMSALRVGRTSITVTHRLGTLRGSDLIVVVADGAVVEQGDHSTLIARGGRYAELFALQAEGYQTAAAGP